MQGIVQMAANFIRKQGLEIVLFFVLVAVLLLWTFPPVYSVIFLILFLVIVIPLNSHFVLSSIQKGVTDIRHKPLSTTLVFICAVLFMIWSLSFESIFFLTLFLCILLYQWDNRVLVAGALISLVACPFLLILSQEAYAEQMAVYAYYFLVMTVVLQIIEYKRNPQAL